MDKNDPASKRPFAELERDVRLESSPYRDAITSAHRIDEATAVHSLLSQISRSPESDASIHSLATQLVQVVRARRRQASGVDALMHEFSLSSDEGVALMCLAEALLRIPDRATADRLIAEKIGGGDWRRHLGESPSLFVNAAAWGLMITGKLVSPTSEQSLGAALKRLAAKGGETVIRRGVELAMQMLGRQFVAGQTIEEAIDHAQGGILKGYRYSFDMLGEAALTAADAERYFNAYQHAVHAVGGSAGGASLYERPGISVKLSALHPRYVRAQRRRVMQELLPRLRDLFILCRDYGIGLSIDAEESDRLELSLDLIETLALEPELRDFEGFGVVVQAYQKRAPAVIDFLTDLARRRGSRIMVRLVKGAYWDTEIKRAQVEGASDYPVFTRKAHTDVSYLACAQKMLDAAGYLFPQFATHNAQTLAAVRIWAQERRVVSYEFQCLHGMGETLYDQLVGREKGSIPCRIYAPVGSHETLLAYLVRRLLENGANTSFVNRIIDESVSVKELVANPLDLAGETRGQPHPHIPLPEKLFRESRQNSAGLDLNDEAVLFSLYSTLCRGKVRRWTAAPLIACAADLGDIKNIINPSNCNDIVGNFQEVHPSSLKNILNCAIASSWKNASPATRADILYRASRLFEEHCLELIELSVREAGKTFSNAVSEVREAVDFLRYYASQLLEHPEGKPLGIVTCISPWNFPLSIFIGQVSAALAAGNAVLAKPAEQTPLIAFRATQLLHLAGIPRDALQLLPGAGETVGAALVTNEAVDGVVFTGSTETARLIYRSLAERTREKRDVRLIAETGGQNAMIVDSSALPEQVVQDVIVSAFDSAGQRCSALRILCVQNEVADRILGMLRGALAEYRVGETDRLDTDIGPVIDRNAQLALLSHIQKMQAAGYPVWQAPLTPETQEGCFVAPTVIEIDLVDILKKEVFGPVLHFVRYRRDDLPDLMESINRLGYGLTMGVHSRIAETIRLTVSQARAGNLYVNRSMIGAAVGMQPFGGEGLSGTGPKAGGPLYLRALQRDSILPPGFAQSPANPALLALLQVAREKVDENTWNLAAHYLSLNLTAVEMPLPSPAGETNLLRLVPKGRILCVSEIFSDIFIQAAAALSNFNRVCLPSSCRGVVPKWLCDVLANEIVWMDEEQLELEPTGISLVLSDQQNLARMRKRFAAVEGPIIPVIPCDSVCQAPIEQLFIERTLTVNTAAVGGNPGLLALEA